MKNKALMWIVVMAFGGELLVGNANEPNKIEDVVISQGENANQKRTGVGSSVYNRDNPFTELIKQTLHISVSDGIIISLDKPIGDAMDNWVQVGGGVGKNYLDYLEVRSSLLRARLYTTTFKGETPQYTKIFNIG